MKEVFLSSLIILLVMIISGRSINPYIKEVTVDSDKVTSGSEIKLFVTIHNPTNIEFEPYVFLKYDTKALRYQTQYYSSSYDTRIKLESIPDSTERSYLLTFYVNRDTDAGSYPIDIYLYGGETAKESLSYATKTIEVVSVPK